MDHKSAAAEFDRQRTAPREGAVRLARAVDAVTLVLFGAALFVELAGRGLIVGVGQFVLPSASVLLFVAAAVLAIRHVALPRPGIRATIAGWHCQLEARPHMAAAARAFLFTRPLVFFVGYFAVVTFGIPQAPGLALSQDPLGNLPARFDAGWYGGIALDGYEWDQQFRRQRNIAFFPALPMLMRPVGAALGMNTVTLPHEKRLLRAIWAGVFISLVAFAWALYYVSRLGGLLLGGPAATSAPLLLAAYPFAVFFNAPYAEALFLLGTVGAFYHFHRAEWVRASIFGLLVGFSRPNGCFLSIPLALLGVQQLVRGASAKNSPAGLGAIRIAPVMVRLLVAAMPGIAMLAFTAYLYRLTGVWLAWARMHGAWGRTWGTGPVQQGWERLTAEGLMPVFEGAPFDTLNTLAVLFGLALVWPVFRRLGLPYGMFVLLNLVPPVFAGGAMSMGRLTSTLFPIFLALASMVRPSAIPSWVCSFALVQGLVASLFFTWQQLF